MPVPKGFGGDTKKGPAPVRSQSSVGVIGDRPNRDLAAPTPVDSSLPPLGDISRCTPFIVAQLAPPDPAKALAEIQRNGQQTDEEWNTIKKVKSEAHAILTSSCKNSVAKALLAVRKVASPAHPDSEVGKALRPLETSLAEAVGKRAHMMAVEQHWLNKDGPRAEFLRGCEVQIEKQLTPRLRSRMLLTYHKIYGSAEKVGEALFNSKSYAHYLRKGYKRPGRKKPRAKANLVDEDRSGSSEQEGRDGPEEVAQRLPKPPQPPQLPQPEEKEPQPPAVPQAVAKLRSKKTKKKTLPVNFAQQQQQQRPQQESCPSAPVWSPDACYTQYQYVGPHGYPQAEMEFYANAGYPSYMPQSHYQQAWGFVPAWS